MFLQQCLLLPVWLHYYYDGFIWKVREQSTKAGLGIAEKVKGNDLTSESSFYQPGQMAWLRNAFAGACRDAAVYSEY